MARVGLTVNTIDLDGVAESLTAGTADQWEFANDGNVFIHIIETGGNTRTVTAVAQDKTAGGASWDDEVFTLTANQEKVHGPFNTKAFNTAAGLVELDIDASHADVSIQVFKAIRTG